MLRRLHRPTPRPGRAPRIALALLGVAACARQKVDPVDALLASLERAAEARDAEALGRHLAGDFTGAHGLVRADALAEAGRYLAAYESVSVEIAQVETTRADDSAHVRCLVAFSGRPRRVLGLDALLPPDAAYRFELDLVRGEAGWQVRRAEWEPAAAASGPQ